MKNRILFLSMAMVAAIFFTACKSDDNNNGQDTGVHQIESIAKSGDWRITYYFDSDHEETHHFNGYNFSFNQDGSLVAVKGTTTVTGTWSVTDDSSNDDDGNSGDVDFNIYFASPPNFEDLSDDWDIVSVSNSKIELIDVSGGNGGTDFLTFEKL